MEITQTEVIAVTITPNGCFFAEDSLPLGSRGQRFCVIDGSLNANLQKISPKSATFIDAPHHVLGKLPTILAAWTQLDELAVIGIWQMPSLKFLANTQVSSCRLRGVSIPVQTTQTISLPHLRTLALVECRLQDILNVLTTDATRALVKTTYETVVPGADIYVIASPPERIYSLCLEGAIAMVDSLAVGQLSAEAIKIAVTSVDPINVIVNKPAVGWDVIIDSLTSGWTSVEYLKICGTLSSRALRWPNLNRLSKLRELFLRKLRIDLASIDAFDASAWKHLASVVIEDCTDLLGRHLTEGQLIDIRSRFPIEKD